MFRIKENKSFCNIIRLKDRKSKNKAEECWEYKSWTFRFK